VTCITRLSREKYGVDEYERWVSDYYVHQYLVENEREACTINIVIVKHTEITRNLSRTKRISKRSTREMECLHGTEQ
jgi:hypothetical protein